MIPPTPPGCANSDTNQNTRRLTVRDLVIHGLIYMVPLAPIGVFGIIHNMSAGTVAADAVAAVAMLFSAISYKEMAQQFTSLGRPTATSASGRTASSDSSPAARSCSTICFCPRCCAYFQRAR